MTTPEVYTEQGVPVMADGRPIIKIGGSISEIATAAEQFLGKPKIERENEAKEVFRGTPSFHPRFDDGRRDLQEPRQVLTRSPTCRLARFSEDGARDRLVHD